MEKGGESSYGNGCGGGVNGPNGSFHRQLQMSFGISCWNGAALLASGLVACAKCRVLAAVFEKSESD